MRPASTSPFMQRALLGRALHRPGRAGRRHLPRAAPAGADGRRHRPRRRHRRRARPAHRHLPHLDRGGRRGRSARVADRGHPRARPRQRRRRAGPAVLRRPRRRRAAHRARRAERGDAAGVPVRLDHHDLAAATCWSRWRWPPWCSWSASGCPRSCSRSRRTRSSPGSPASTCALYNLLVAVLAAVSVTVAMRTVGLLLVSALMVVPVATSQQLTRSSGPRWSPRWPWASLASVGGLVVSALRSTPPPGATIVLLSLAGFVVTWPVGAWLRRRAAAAARRSPAGRPEPEHEPPPTSHPHEHGPDCGHVAVPHGDHVDYSRRRAARRPDAS